MRILVTGGAIIRDHSNGTTIRYLVRIGCFSNANGTRIRYYAKIDR